MTSEFVISTLYYLLAAVSFWAMLLLFYRYKNPRWYLYFAFGSVVIAVSNIIIPQNHHIPTIIQFIFAVLVVKDDIISKILNILLAYTSTGVVFSLFKIVLRLFISKPVDEMMVNVIIGLVTSIIILYAHRTGLHEVLILYFGQSKKLNKVINLILIVATELLITYGEMMGRDFVGEGFASVYLLIALVAAVLIGYMMISVCVDYYKQDELKTENETKEIIISEQKAIYSLLMEKNNEVKKFRHDLNNNLGTIQLLLENDKIEDAKDFMKKLTSENNNLRIRQVYFGNEILDTLIVMMVGRANDNNVDIRVNGEMNFEGVNIYDICCIFSNALSNATESCILQKCSGPVNVNAVSKGGVQIISFSNPATADMFENIQNRKSGKKDSGEHGIGIGNIINAASRLKGRAEYSFENGEVILKIMLGL